MTIEEVNADELPIENPLRHMAHNHRRLKEIVEHLRKDMFHIHEPRAESILETAAQTLEDLMEEMEDYVESVDEEE